MNAFRLAGINRVSLGVQTLDEGLLTTLTRTHSAKQSIDAIQTLLSAGIDNISIDLMYDLPGQTYTSWQETLQQAVALPITHLSLYNLTIEPHTVYYKHRQKLPLPDDQLSLEMLSLAIETLERGGFQRYEFRPLAEKEMSQSTIQVTGHSAPFWASGHRLSVSGIKAASAIVTT